MQEELISFGEIIDGDEQYAKLLGEAQYKQHDPHEWSSVVCRLSSRTSIDC